jgi:hypothetical protein
MAGIDSIVNTRAEQFASNPQALMQRYSMNQNLLDLLALQKLKQEKEAAARNLQMQMQPPPATVKDQLQGQVLDMTKREVAQAAAPGLAQLGQQIAADRVRQAVGAGGGLPSQPAPNMEGMAEGGIVGYNGKNESYVDTTQPAKTDPVIGYSADGAEIHMSEASSVPGGDRLALEYAKKTQGESARENWGRVGQGIVQFLNPQPSTAQPRAEARAFTPAEMEARKQAAQDNVIDTYNPGDPRLKGLHQEAPTGIQTVVPDLSAAIAGGESMRPQTQAQTQATPQPQAAAAPQLSDDERLVNTLKALGYGTAPAADPRVSEYEKVKQSIEDQKKDKMGAIVDFLLAAGRSGGTNLGATLTGGGSGIQARNERLDKERAEVAKNIEDLKLKTSQLGSEDRRAALQAAAQLTGHEIQAQSARDVEGMRAASGEKIAKMDNDARRAISAAEINVKNQELDLNHRLKEAQTIVDTVKAQYESNKMDVETLNSLNTVITMGAPKGSPTVAAAEALRNQIVNRMGGGSGTSGADQQKVNAAATMLQKLGK